MQGRGSSIFLPPNLILAPFNPNVFDQAELELHRNVHGRGTPASVTTERFVGPNHYVLQVEAFGRAIRGQQAYPATLEFAKGTQEMIDRAFAAAK